MPSSVEAPDTGGSGAGGAITRKLGPLPVWGWAIVVAGGVLVARKLGGSKPTGGTSAPGVYSAGDVVGAGATGAVGDPGAAGAAGAAGEAGAAGASAYELAVQNGFTGTLDEWLASLKATGGVPSSYTSNLNKLFDWFQELARTTQIIDTLRAKRYASSSATERANLDKVLAQLTGSGSGKVTYNNYTYYQRGYLNTQINNLQTGLGSTTT